MAPDRAVILAGDVGGTNARLAVFEVQGGRLVARAEQVFRSHEHDGLEAIAARFNAAHGLRVGRAAFGVAGPVLNGRCETTNLPWVVDARGLARALGLEAVWILNDLEANAYGIAELVPGDLVTLAPGAPGAIGNRAVIAAGTGLGEAGLCWDETRHVAFACEGGHASFAPRTAQEIELLRFLLRRHAHVSWERVISGPGLHAVYEFLRDTGAGEEPPWLREAMVNGDPSAAISRAALDGRSPLCAQALDLFVELYGAEAGNLALKLMATGGVFLGGGIAPKIVSKLQGPAFHEAFLAKGRMRRLLEGIPVHVILNDRTALLGAARYAALRAGLRAAPAANPNPAGPAR